MDLSKTGALIAEARREKGLTQAQLAQQLHISHTTVSKWERGLGFPEVSLLEPLAQALELSLSELFRGERTASASPEEEQVAQAAAQLLKEKKREARGLRIAFLVCVAIVIGLLTWSIITMEKQPHEEDIRGTYQNNAIQIGPGAFRWEGGYHIQLAVQNYGEDHTFELCINGCLVDQGIWEKRRSNLYRLTGDYCRLTVELHKDGSFYLELPGLEEVVLMSKLGEVPVYNGGQEHWDHVREDLRALLTER